MKTLMSVSLIFYLAMPGIANITYASGVTFNCNPQNTTFHITTHLFEGVVKCALCSATTASGVTLHEMDPGTCEVYSIKSGLPVNKANCAFNKNPNAVSYNFFENHESATCAFLPKYPAYSGNYIPIDSPYNNCIHQQYNKTSHQWYQVTYCYSAKNCRIKCSDQDKRT